MAATTTATTAYPNGTVDSALTAAETADFPCVTLTSFDDPGVTVSGAIYLVSSVFFEVTGMLGNLLSVAVFSSSPMRRISSTVYLLALAVSDVLYLASVFLTKTLPFLRCWDLVGAYMDLVNHSDTACVLLQYFSDLFSDTSVCLIFAFTVERSLAVHLPTRLRELCTVSRSRRACLVIFLGVAVAIAPHHVLFIGLYRGQGVCVVLEDYENLFTAAYAVESLLLRILPIAAVGLMNVLITARLRKIARHRNVLRLERLERGNEMRFLGGGEKGGEAIGGRGEGEEGIGMGEKGEGRAEGRVIAGRKEERGTEGGQHRGTGNLDGKRIEVEARGDVVREEAGIREGEGWKGTAVEDKREINERGEDGKELGTVAGGAEGEEIGKCRKREQKKGRVEEIDDVGEQWEDNFKGRGKGSGRGCERRGRKRGEFECAVERKHRGKGRRGGAAGEEGWAGARAKGAGEEAEGAGPRGTGAIAGRGSGGVRGSGGSRGGNRGGSGGFQMTITLILVSTTYILLHIPVLVHFVITKFVRSGYLDISRRTIFISQNYSRSLYIAAFAVNFFLYTVRGRVFRDQLHSLLCPVAARRTLSSAL